VAKLRVLCPTRYPVEVRRVRSLGDAFGDCDLAVVNRRRRFRIRLLASLDPHFQVWVLVHEWAHAMTWELTHERHSDHGAHFGIAYSEAYTAIYGSLS
jgi:hypothetical protein